jgi:hypothetical protein
LRLRAEAGGVSLENFVRAVMRAISCLGAISIFLFVHPVNAQSTRNNPRDVVVETNRQELDNLLLRKPILTAEDKRAQQIVLKQINEDFKALQVLNNRLMADSLKEAVDYKSLAKLLSEIGNKASRLKSNLVLPKPDVETQTEPEGAFDEPGFQGALKTFDKVVVSFSNNPIFQKVNVIEVELAKQASRDLEAIIDQGSRLKRLAVKLSKR